MVLASGTPGPGGYAALILIGDAEQVISGRDPNTTNNRMELTAAIRALEALPSGIAAVIHSDSQYVVKGITEWLPGWKRQGGWRTGDKKPVLNQDPCGNAWTPSHAAREVTWIVGAGPCRARAERARGRSRQRRGSEGGRGERLDAWSSLRVRGRVGAQPPCHLILRCGLRCSLPRPATDEGDRPRAVVSHVSPYACPTVGGAFPVIASRTLSWTPASRPSVLNRCRQPWFGSFRCSLRPTSIPSRWTQAATFFATIFACGFFAPGFRRSGSKKRAPPFLTLRELQRSPVCDHDGM